MGEVPLYDGMPRRWQGHLKWRKSRGVSFFAVKYNLRFLSRYVKIYTVHNNFSTTGFGILHNYYLFSRSVQVFCL